VRFACDWIHLNDVYGDNVFFSFFFSVMESILIDSGGKYSVLLHFFGYGSDGIMTTTLYQISSHHSTYIALLLVVFLMFLAQCDSRLVKPTLSQQELLTKKGMTLLV